MRRTGRVATWLEVAAAAYSKHERISLYVHPLMQANDRIPAKRRGQSSYGITLEGRWLHSGNGRLTVFKGRKAVARFMRLIRVSWYQSGEPARIDVDCGKTAHCLATDRNRALHGCA